MVDPSPLPLYGSYGILVIVIIIDAKFRLRFHLLSSYLPFTAAYNYSENEQNSLFHEISENSRSKRKFCWIRTSFVFAGWWL